MGYTKLYCEGAQAITGISNCFIDDYMPEANGEYVKVYLYLIRCMGDSNLSCSVSAIADRFDHTEKDVIRALKYWERRNVLRLNFDSQKQLTGIVVLPLNSIDDYSKAAAAPQVSIMPAATNITSIQPTAEPSQPKAPERREYSPGEINSLRQNPEVSELFYIIEAYIGKPLGISDINTVLYWYEDLSFTNDMIDYLVEYCVSKGHKAFRYMDRVALDWHENGITSLEAAKAETEKHNKTNYTVIKALGISGRDLAKSEKAFLEKWTKEWGFSLALIEEACKRTIEATHQPSFAYADKVLETWRNNQVTDLDGVSRLDQAFSQKHKVQINTSASRKQGNRNYPERNYDFDQLEQKLLKVPVQ